MREIKFRGMGQGGAWFYGSLIIAHQPGGLEQVGIRDDLLGCIIPVSPETVGQYTGQKDTAKGEIYEGDIIESRGEVMEVVYDEDGFYVFDPKMGGFGPLVVQKGFCKVIGNRFDNPELLKVKE